MVSRGQIYNRTFATQQIDYSGLWYPGNITPTDIDGVCSGGPVDRARGFIDFSSRLFIFMEFKYRKSEPPYGQILAFERLIDNCMIPAYYFICGHEYPPEEDILAHLTIVFRVRSNWIKKAWLSVPDINLKSCIDRLRIRWGVS